MKKVIKKIIQEEKDNKFEAKILLDYAKMECDDVKIVLPMLNAMLINETPETLDGWNWKIAKFINDRTSYVFVDMDTDVDFETGDWGIPIITGGVETPIGISIEDKDNLMCLRQEVDDILNHTTDKISKFISMENKPEWKCQGCNRFFKKDLSSIEEIKKLLRNFSIKKYWKCRSCKLPNYFVFNETGIVFKKTLD
jgi:hypothetical protein